MKIGNISKHSGPVKKRALFFRPHAAPSGPEAPQQGPRLGPVQSWVRRPRQQDKRPKPEDKRKKYPVRTRLFSLALVRPATFSASLIARIPKRNCV